LHALALPLFPACPLALYLPAGFLLRRTTPAFMAGAPHAAISSRDAGTYHCALAALLSAPFAARTLTHASTPLHTACLYLSCAQGLRASSGTRHGRLSVGRVACQHTHCTSCHCTRRCASPLHACIIKQADEQDFCLFCCTAFTKDTNIYISPTLSCLTARCLYACPSATATICRADDSLSSGMGSDGGSFGSIITARLPRACHGMDHIAYQYHLYIVIFPYARTRHGGQTAAGRGGTL